MCKPFFVSWNTPSRQVFKTCDFPQWLVLMAILPSNSPPSAWNKYLKHFFEIPVSRIFPHHIVLFLQHLQEACQDTEQHQVLLNRYQEPCTIVGQNSGKNILVIELNI